MDQIKLDEVVKELNRLTRSSKKGRPSADRKKRYAENMLLLLTHEGLSERSINCLFDGFGLERAKPFFEFFSRDTTDRMSVLKEMLDKARLGKKRDMPLKFMLNLLALCANTRLNEKGPVIACIIEALPKLSKTRVGGNYSGIDKSVADLFLGDLKPNFEMPSFRELGLSSGIFFTDELIESAFAKLKATEENERLIQKIRVWLKDDDRAGKNGRGAAEGKTAREEPDRRDTRIEEQPAVSLDVPWAQMLDKIKGHLEFSDARIKTLLTDLDEKDKRISDLNKRIGTAGSDDISTRREDDARTSELLEEIKDYKSRIVQYEDSLKQKDREIEERKLLQLRDRAEAKKSSDDFKDRLASELGFDYTQFKDAMKMKMNPELGETMRDRLKSIFKILIKNGLNIE
ncbi:MAG: hypothetical protein LBI74_01320 [Synergistaceae bacterium]|jgi:hypothetical protein|nr:hypothetical protein [Synergistaceae bacterium]